MRATLKVDFEDDIIAAACITHERRDQKREGSEVAMSLMTEITIFVLAVFVGFEVISKVPTTLHTPLMSQTNAIHGIVMLGGLIVLGYANDGLEYLIGTIAIAFGAINIVGGFMVTDRMLGMFARKPKPKADADGKGGPDDPWLSSSRAATPRPRSTSSPSRCSSSGSNRAPTRPRPSAAT